MALKSQLEAIIYAAEEPVTLEQLALVLKDTVLADPALAEMQPAERDKEIKSRVRAAVEELAAEYANSDRGMEIRQVAGGWRMGTKPEHHDLVRHFVKSLKPPMRLSLPALETLSVIAYKQPVTAPEISEIRGVDSSGVVATLLDRKLITTAGRKQVIGRPILYKTSKEFLLRFGLKDVTELPSLEEFEKLAESQGDLFEPPGETAGAQAGETQDTGAAGSEEGSVAGSAEEGSAAANAEGGSAGLQPGEHEDATEGALAPAESAHGASEIVPEQDELPSAAGAQPGSDDAATAPPAEPASESPESQESTPSVAPGDETSQSAEPVSDFPQ